MAGNFDATIKLLYAADAGTTFAVDELKLNTAFDVVADIEIGATLNGIATAHSLSVAVRNLTKSTTVRATVDSRALAPAGTPRTEPFRIQFAGIAPGAGGADEGDILEVVAGYKVTAGINTDFSLERGELFIVSA